MFYTRRIPAVALRDFVDHLWCLTDGPTHATERVLPAGTTELVINLRDDAIQIENHQGPQQFSGSVVSGPYSRPFDIDARDHTAMIGVHFKPGGAQSFLGVSPVELLDTHVDLGQLWHGAADALRTRVCEAGSAADRFALIESALLGRLHAEDALSKPIAGTLDALTHGSDHPPIRALARETGLSHRRFIQLFTTQVGMPPKRFARVCRFRRAHHAVTAARLPEWSRFAIEHGYADQSHMIREFQAFSGLTPAEHLRKRALITKDDHIALRA